MGQSTDVCAEGKQWQWVSLCHFMAVQQSMTLMTTPLWPHREKAAVAMASLYGDSSS